MAMSDKDKIDLLRLLMASTKLNGDHESLDKVKTMLGETTEKHIPDVELSNNNITEYVLTRPDVMNVGGGTRINFIYGNTEKEEYFTGSDEIIYFLFKGQHPHAHKIYAQMMMEIYKSYAWDKTMIEDVDVAVYDDLSDQAALFFNSQKFRKTKIWSKKIFGREKQNIFGYIHDVANLYGFTLDKPGNDVALPIKVHASFPDTIDTLEKLHSHTWQNIDQEKDIKEISDVFSSLQIEAKIGQLNIAGRNRVEIEPPEHLNTVERFKFISEVCQHVLKQSEKAASQYIFRQAPNNEEAIIMDIPVNDKRTDLVSFLEKVAKVYQDKSKDNTHHLEQMGQIWTLGLGLKTEFKPKENSGDKEMVITFPTQDNGLPYKQIGLSGDPRYVLKDIMTDRGMKFDKVSVSKTGEPIVTMSVPNASFNDKFIVPILSKFTQSLAKAFVRPVHDGTQIVGFEVPDFAVEHLKRWHTLEDKIDNIENKTDVSFVDEDIKIKGYWSKYCSDKYGLTSFRDDLLNDLTSVCNTDRSEIERYVKISEGQRCDLIKISPGIILDEPVWFDDFINNFGQVFNALNQQYKRLGKKTIKSQLSQINNKLNFIGASARTKTTEENTMVEIYLEPNSHGIDRWVSETFYKILSEENIYDHFQEDGQLLSGILDTKADDVAKDQDVQYLTFPLSLFQNDFVYIDDTAEHRPRNVFQRIVNQYSAKISKASLNIRFDDKKINVEFDKQKRSLFSKSKDPIEHLQKVFGYQHE